jgi:hypothetical protein
MVVELKGKCISKTITGTGKCFVVTTCPCLEGHIPVASEEKQRGNSIALVGQVPVNVCPGEEASDQQLLIPSGSNDGNARAVSLDDWWLM